MLAVMAIVTVLLAMLAPAVRSFSDTAGRRGAVNVVMNTLEQARVSALESGREVQVLFYRVAFPHEDRLVVIRELEDGSGYEQLTKWLKLPKGVLLFKPTAGHSVFESAVPASVLTALPANLSTSALGNAGIRVVNGIAAIKFNASGQVAYPTDSSQLLLHLSEGVRDEDGVEARITQKQAASLPFEIISLSKYTGRAQLDITELAAN
ncbi:MAG TPA: hypothetical protein VIS74_00110 [Chthoniobacterales bacterium]